MNNFRIWFVSSIYCVACAACPPTPTPVPPDAMPDAGLDVEDASDDALSEDSRRKKDAGLDPCAQGEAQLLKLACKDSRGRLLGGPNLSGVPWAAICRENAAHGVDMKPLCVASKTSCKEITSCP